MNWIVFALALPMEQPARSRLMAIIQRLPGLHTTQLSRETGQARGTVQYHLRLLEQNGMVARVQSNGIGRFYPAGIAEDRLRLLGLLHGRRQQIAQLVQAQPGLRQVDICQALQLSRKTFRASIEALVEAGLVLERRGLQAHRYYPGQVPWDVPGAPGAGPGAPRGPARGGGQRE